MKSNNNIYLESLKKEILPNNKLSDFLIRILEKRLKDPAKENINKHHIFPRSWGGPDNKDNFVKLTGSEHFKVHQLLSEVTIDKDKKSSMKSAYWWMSNCGVYKIKNHKEYEKLRIWFSKQQSEKMKEWRNNMSEEEKKEYSKKLSESIAASYVNKTSEDRQKTINKQKQTWNNKSKEKKKEEQLKRLKTIENYTEEQKKEIGRNISLSKIGKYRIKFTQEESNFILSVFDIKRKNWKETIKLFNEKFRNPEDYVSGKAIYNHIRKMLNI